MKPTLHEQLVTRLALFRGQHAQIARDCGIAQATISRVARGESSPTLAVAQPIFDWMDKHAKEVGVIRVLPAPARLREKGKKNNANGRSLRDLKPARAAHR